MFKCSKYQSFIICERDDIMNAGYENRIFSRCRWRGRSLRRARSRGSSFRRFRSSREADVTTSPRLFAFFMQYPGQISRPDSHSAFVEVLFRSMICPMADDMPSGDGATVCGLDIKRDRRGEIVRKIMLHCLEWDTNLHGL